MSAVGTTCGKCGRPHVRMGRRTCKAHRRDGSPCMTFPVGGCEYGVVCRMHSGTEPRHRAKVLRRRELEETEKWLVRLLRQHRGKGNR